MSAYTFEIAVRETFGVAMPAFVPTVVDPMDGLIWPPHYETRAGRRLFETRFTRVS